MLLRSLLLSTLALAAATPPPFVREGPAAIDEQVTMLGSPDRTFRIAILPDRTTGRDWGLPYLEAAVRDLNRIRPDAVFTVGDMIQGYTRDEAEWDRQANQWKSITSALDAPLFPVAGNHDVLSGSRVAGDSAFGDRYLRTFGPLKYMAELDGASVIALFSDESFGDGGVKLSDAQIGWLKNCLERAKARGKPILLLMHRPLWRTESVKWFERVHPALVEAGVDAVIAGHFHSMQHDGARDGVQYVIVGTCGGSIDQHPLAGQLQHLSFVQLEPDGTLELFHQPVGLTLPADFVVREDQDRVYALRERPGSLKLQGTLPDPAEASAPLSGEITLQVTNPLDRPIEVDCRLWTEPEAWPVDGELFMSRTAIDAFNPFTVDAKTDYRLDPVPALFTVPARGSVSVPMKWHWPRAQGPVAPPTIVVRERFTDSKGRVVPVYQWLRPAVRRTLTADGSAWPMHAWSPSPYDTLEADPIVRITHDATTKTLVVRTEVADSVSAKSAPGDRARGDRRVRDPGADAVKVIWTDAEGDGWAIAEPFTPEVSASASARAPQVTSGSLPGGGWWAELRIPVPAGPPSSLNVGVADNDNTYHTQWRWLAPTEAPAALRTIPTP
ncbi:MAG: metallophosphoesterase [Planctomycetes bacterium]|nr:metallophosphoesterase [Planctomycetota bacterium]